MGDNLPAFLLGEGNFMVLLTQTQCEYNLSINFFAVLPCLVTLMAGWAAFSTVALHSWRSYEQL